MSERLMPWRYVVAILAFAAGFAIVMRAIRLTGPGYWLVAAFVACGIALIVERRTRG